MSIRPSSLILAGLLVVACGASDSRKVARPLVDGGDAGPGDSGGTPGDSSSSAGATGAGGDGTGTGGAGTAGGGAGPGGSGQGGGTGGTGGGGGSEAGAGGATVNYCTVGTCPVGVDAMVGLTRQSAITEYRAETGGPYWDVASGPPPGAACFCVINEYDDFPCTSDADCDESTCDTATTHCRKPGQHDHGPFANPAVDPVTDLVNGTWGDHFGPNCPYVHLHGFSGPLVTPANTASVSETPRPDTMQGTCGHGGLVWIDAQGNVLTGPVGDASAP